MLKALPCNATGDPRLVFILSASLASKQPGRAKQSHLPVRRPALSPQTFTILSVPMKKVLRVCPLAISSAGTLIDHRDNLSGAAGERRLEQTAWRQTGLGTGLGNRARRDEKVLSGV